MIPMPSVFKKDPATGLAIPELNPECADWVLKMTGSGTVTTTIMVDGVECKVSDGSQGKVFTRRTEPVHTPTGWVVPYMIMRRDQPADKPYFEAFDARTSTPNGRYIVYGPDIKGNPQKVSKHMMVSIDPIETFLCVYPNTSGIERWDTVKRFYDSIKKSLEDGDAEGVVFRLEEPYQTLKAWAKVKRTDFGMPWPIPAPTDKKCLYYGCQERLPIDGPAYCVKCREGRIGNMSTDRQLKKCKGENCIVYLAPDGHDLCTECRNKVANPVGLLTGNNAVPHV